MNSSTGLEVPAQSVGSQLLANTDFSGVVAKYMIAKRKVTVLMDGKHSIIIVLFRVVK